MENSENKSAEQVNYENDILAQIQGYPDFASAPKGDPTKDAEEIIQHMSDQLNTIPDEVFHREFDFEVPVRENGDCFDRYMMRMLELREALKIIEQVLIKLEPGEILAKVPKIIKPPAGEAYVRTESPKGELALYLVSDGTANPYRLHLRAPSFINLQILQKILTGVKVADVIAILGSIDITLGEVDR